MIGSDRKVGDVFDMETSADDIRKTPLILVDGSSYLHRAYHALPQLANSHGEPTGAIYGVINMLRRLINDYGPEYIAVVFDAKGKNFRHEIYPEYKATRPPLPDDLRQQIHPLYDVIKAMGLPLVVVEGVEADDVIATLTGLARKAGLKVLISTGDKDLAQLVNDDVTLINTMTNVVLDSKGVRDKFGVMPDRIVDYLALVGDNSDNVPGVPMVGPKTAVKLLKEYGSLNNLLEHAHAVSGKIGENLQRSVVNLPLIRKLVTVKDDVVLPCQIHDLLRQQQDRQKLIDLFRHLEFKTWLMSLLEEASVADHHFKAVNYQVILTQIALDEYVKLLNSAASFAFDLETTSLDIINAKIVGISLATDIDHAVYIPVGHDYPGAPVQLSCADVLQQLKPLLENEDKKKLGQNLKFDMSVLASYAIALRGVAFDTMLESYVLNSSSNKHDKETLVFKYLGKTLTTFSDLAGKGSKQLTFNQIELDKAALYAATDAAVVWQLHEVLWTELSKHQDLVEVFKDIEIPLLSVLSHMERRGVCIDVELLREHSRELAVKLDNLEKEAYQIAGSVFNLNSPLQLQEILFNKLQLPVLQKTPKGQPSTAEQVLQELALEYQLPQLILEYRSLSKLKSTYTDSLPQQVNSATGRVHTSYNQAVAVTGRLSSTEPNLQNIPARSDEGRRIRQAFVASPGYKVVSADYSQIELRIMAHLSQDAGLLQAFAIDSDIHRATAAEVFGVSLAQVTAEQRQRAKMINFGLIYGMSAFGLAKRLGLSKAAAQGYIDIYFKHYPSVKAYMERAKLQAQQLGYVTTIFGRRLYIPDIKSRNFHLRSAAERAAINAPMQGSAADLMKIAMIKIDAWLQQTDLDINMIMQVHDELVFEIADGDIDKAIPKIKYYMENATKLSVPVLTHVGVGNNWDEAH